MLLMVFSAFVIAGPPWKNNPCPIKLDTNVVFYGETGFGGVGTPSRSWMIHFLDWWKVQDSSINYVELDSGDVKTDCNLASFPNLKLYIQPGGNAYYQQNKLGQEGKNSILNYLNNGGHFFGTCAGFFYAAGDYWWQDEFYNHPYLLGLFPTVEGSIREIADYDGNPGYALTSLSNGFNAIYYGGPTRGYEYTSLAGTPGIIDSTYTEYGNGMPAVIKNGNMLLTSVHLEAYENDGITGLTTVDRIENYKYLANLLNEVAGTSFYVPHYANPPVCGNGIKEVGEICDEGDLGGESCQSQGFDNGILSCLNDCSGFEVLQCINYPAQCNDGIDNDADGLIDYPNDLGCDSVEDDSELDGPVEILFDGFEDGNLAGWVLSGIGNQWIASTDSSYEGSWSARAKQTGAGEDSFMEIDIDASGYSAVDFEYYRKLVGLDAADDFEVSYYDGTWHSVEHLGSSSENNANFLFKKFSIPSSASKIRFKCECGAVSEMCYIDNVKITAE